MLGSGTTIGLGHADPHLQSRASSSAGIFAVLIVLSMLGVALHGATVLLQKALLFWQRPAS